jgi:hypothetical protein
VSKRVTLLSIQLEVGPETRAMIERLADNPTATIHLEFGPKTLATLNDLIPRAAKREGAERPQRRTAAEASRGA